MFKLLSLFALSPSRLDKVVVRWLILSHAHVFASRRAIYKWRAICVACHSVDATPLSGSVDHNTYNYDKGLFDYFTPFDAAGSCLWQHAILIHCCVLLWRYLAKQDYITRCNTRTGSRIGEHINERHECKNDLSVRVGDDWLMYFYLLLLYWGYNHIYSCALRASRNFSGSRV